MKARTSFVSNSSSSSFIIPKNKLNKKQIYAIVNNSEFGKQLNIENAEDRWQIEVTDDAVCGYTSMDNYAIRDLFDAIGVNPEDVEWSEHDMSRLMCLDNEEEEDDES